MKSLRIGIVASVLAVGALVPMLMGPSGGLPSRPTFQAVGIGTPPGSFAESIKSNSAQLALDSVSGTADTLTYLRSLGVDKAYIGVAGTAGGMAAGSVAGDLVLRTQGGAIRASTDSGAGSMVMRGTCGLSFVAGASPSLNGGNCGTSATPTVSNTGTGLYTLNHQLGYATHLTVCNVRDTTPTAEFVVLRTLNANNDTIAVYSDAGVLTNSGQNVQCIFVNNN